jgi:hypothetical protein
MPELDLSPAFEAALRSGLADLAEAGPVPDAERFDALEARASTPAARTPRHGRPLALAAAVVVVIAAIVGAVALRDRDGGIERTELNGPIATTSAPATTSTTSASTTAPVGPLVSARSVMGTLGGRPPDGPPNATMMNSVTDRDALAELWAEAGLPASRLPEVDFRSEVVIEIVTDDVGCPSTALEFRRTPSAVRAAAVEPASCPDAYAGPARRAYFYALPWAETGRPFRLEVVQPGDPDALGSIVVD